MGRPPSAVVTISGAKSVTASVSLRMIQEFVECINTPIRKVMVGSYLGVDALGVQWAGAYRCACETILQKKASEMYTLEDMLRLRNAALCNASDILIAFHDGREFATADLIAQFKQNNKPVYMRTF